MRKLKLLSTLPLVVTGLALASCGSNRAYKDAETLANACAAALQKLTSGTVTAEWDETNNTYWCGLAFAASAVDFATLKAAVDSVLEAEEMKLTADEDGWTVAGGYTGQDDTTSEAKYWTVDDLVVEGHVYSYTIKDTPATCIDCWVYQMAE